MWYKYPHLSPYAYCADNPLRYVDPSGMVIDTTDLSQQGQQDYIRNINLLRNSPIFDAYYEHLAKSNNVYYIKEGGGYGGSGSFNESTNEVFSINDAEVLAQELFHAFQTDLNCYSREDMSVRETEGDIVSTNIMSYLNRGHTLNYWDKSNISYNKKYIDANNMFNMGIFSESFDNDFNNAVNARIEFYKQQDVTNGTLSPFSYLSPNSRVGALALKRVLKMIYSRFSK